ncbi:unnamed protein product [Linum tenue]|uniref:beta-aspartyl-peptidase n=1 Tax=Linum tenue TaxID=586396 RepID=A0AAV0RGC6_9ROSI|nr:unnamed protein product [Linum tenue]
MAAPATFHAHFPLTAASLARPLSATASNSASPLSNPTPTLSTSSNSWYAQITSRISSGPGAEVCELENHPQFNAGKGSVLTTDGTVEMEAVIDGKTMRCGAVSGLTTVVNAVSVARLVMDKTPHIYLGFQGAEAFAREHVSPSNFALLLIHNLHSIGILCLSATLGLDFIAKAACC